jgi:polar amino acid transport system permease protein
MDFDFKPVLEELPALLRGAGITLFICSVSIVLSLFVGVALTIAGQSGFRLLRGYVRLHISFARGTPLFVQVMIVYFLLPQLGLRLSPFTAGIIALSLNSAAYGSEIMRGALSAIPKGQIEAARALSMSGWRIWQRIKLPQVFVLMLPPMAFEFAGLIRASAILSVIGVTELTRAGVQIVAFTYKPVEVWLSVGVAYFIMIYTVGLLSRKIENATRASRSV